jgi:hypothetical protein
MDPGIKHKAEVVIDRIRSTVAREAMETRVAATILIKAIRHYSGIGKSKPTQKELRFLRQHSKDLLKLVPMVLMFPTPIPYIEIAVLLKAVGFDLLMPSDKGLEVPEGWRER